MSHRAASPNARTASSTGKARMLTVRPCVGDLRIQHEIQMGQSLEHGQGATER